MSRNGIPFPKAR